MGNRYGIVNGQVVPLPPVDPSLNTATAGLPVQLPPVPRYQSPQLFINQQESAPNLTNIYTPSAPTLTNIYTPGPRPTLSNINQVPQRSGTRIEASTSAEDRRLARIGLEQRQRMNASTSGSSDYGVQWTVKPVKPTAKQLEIYGPNAAGVLGAIQSTNTLSPEAVKIVLAAEEEGLPARAALGNVVWDAVEEEWDAPWGAALDALEDMKGVARDAALDAAVAETVKDVITSEQYKIHTDPLKAGATYDRILKSLPANQQGSFRSAVIAGKPKSAEEVEQIANLSSSEMDRLGSLTGDTPLEKKIALVQRANRAMTADAAERAANRAKAVREVK